MTEEAPWICIIGGGKSQAPFISAASALGARTLVFDGDANAPGRELADRFVGVSTHDTAAVLNHLHGFDGGPPAGCFTYSSFEQALTTTAAVVERYGLFGLTTEALHRTWSKAQMRAHLDAAGVATPAWRRAEGAADLDEFLADHPRAIVKPARGGVGSAGVALVDEAADAAALLAAACEISSDGTAIAEEYLEGEEYSIDGWVTRGEAHVVATSRKHTDPDRFVIDGYVFDSREESPFSDLAAGVVAALALDNTFFSLDVLATTSGPVVLDAGPLLDAKVDRLLHHAGVDVYSIPTATALGNEMDPGAVRPGAHGLRFLYTDRPGAMTRVHPGEPEVVLELEKQPGEEVTAPRSVADTIGWVYATGESAASVWEALSSLDSEELVEVSP